jgi:hypothetical protein
MRANKKTWLLTHRMDVHQEGLDVAEFVRELNNNPCSDDAVGGDHTVGHCACNSTNCESAMRQP